MEKLIIAGKEFNSRLFLGTGKFGSNDIMSRAIEASETEMVTMAMKRIELGNEEDDMMQHIMRPGIQLLPNTSGTRNAEEAVFAAKMSREAFGTNWLKLEIHPDPRYLLPDPVETLKATEMLVKGTSHHRLPKHHHRGGHRAGSCRRWHWFSKRRCQGYGNRCRRLSCKYRHIGSRRPNSYGPRLQEGSGMWT